MQSVNLSTGKKKFYEYAAGQGGSLDLTSLQVGSGGLRDPCHGINIKRKTFIPTRLELGDKTEEDSIETKERPVWVCQRGCGAW